ncbi:Stk1 family PASTA domain-containing Ser/Thr kinase [Lentibacillus cibarius]|uniref:Serine/threonine-protein kinase PrkC n=1 Tax=Lentibacillus cibarius TaxID=2583219 RepID=A0A549YKE0_9BACI|nr:Stk1 family PASTA domain-containing Ser/Thr kinase [Lentibacillus cibarius]TRM12352.1 Stk1 family PASTA domain-containing Ser/Thr kinase [Lentibacillus cibarius]
MLQGYLLNERYKIKEIIGGGGMANVYLARDIILERDVAIKVLRLDYADDEEFIARFDREAQSATSLSHPNIVNIYDVGEEDQFLFMVMEYVDGLTLKEYIQRFAPLDVQEALDIMKQIADAIAHAHANGIVHRDIKPQNILINTYGQVKVTDFGIAVALSATALTQTNSILGSVHYLSPEQARGGMATKKSDIYALGIVFFELLTGRLPFSGQSAVSIALKHLQHDTPSVKRFNPNVPQSVENIVLRATAKDPFHRYNSVYEMEEGLETALDPDKRNEAKYEPPVEAGEETKAIPIITDNEIKQNDNGDTITHTIGKDTTQPSDNNQPGSQSETNKGKRSRKKTWFISLGILFILLAGSIAAFFVLPGLFGPKDVVVPNVRDLSYEDAITDLREVNLKTDREQIYSEEVDEGFVIRTDPAAGNKVKEEDTITLIVSKGEEEVTFNDYTGKDYNQTKRLLEGQGYKVNAEEANSKDVAEGKIISHIYPSPEKEVVPSETEVTFEVSIGPKPINLGNLKGMTEKEAVDSLKEQDLSANIKEENSEMTPEGKVIRQEPKPGTELSKGDAVDVYVSTGPEAKPPINHKETFMVHYNSDKAEENAGAPSEQKVKIFIGDKNRSITEVYKTYTITEDKEFTITLVILPDSIADYKVMRDDDVIINKSVKYEDVKGE